MYKHYPLKLRLGRNSVIFNAQVFIGAFKPQMHGERWNAYTRLCNPAKLPWQTTSVVECVPASAGQQNRTEMVR
ncbi:hypothetical protein [uncultured Nostoc sp.]|uniref:hypothetical protein n=1 Tax=uncultured Nostoc sp. TaxID=340711 RepID=UPI0035CA00C3